MQIKGIIWIGSATDDSATMADFFTGVLGLRKTVDVKGFTQLTMENGDRIELFSVPSPEHELLDTGPVAGLWVDDLDAARDELIAAGTADVTDFDHAPDGHRWFYFRAPDGNYYELCEHPRPRKAKPRADVST